MKIIKRNLTENLDTKLFEDAKNDTPNEDIAVDNVDTTPVDELADAVINAAEEASDGEKTYSDTKATTIAREIKTVAQGFDTAAWAPLDVASELTNKLDDCLANSMISHRVGSHDGTDLLVTGLPGSGKTGITKAWADARGVNLFYLNAKNDDLGAILNGFPVDSTETDADGNLVHKVIRSYSTALEPLEREKSVLFLDEFNRAAPKLRAVLLTLINEHTIEGPAKSGIYEFKNLLFTVACINPSIPTDPGAMDLNDAEMSRFVDSIDWDSKEPEALDYLNFHIDDLKDKLDKKSSDYPFLYKRFMNMRNLANALLGDPKFTFDTREDTLDLFNDKKTMLNQRAITDAIMAHGDSKTKFLNWVDKYSGFLDRDIEKIHTVLDPWTEPLVDI